MCLSWAPPPRQKIDTPSPSVGNFHVKDQHRRLAIVDGEVTTPGGKGKDKLVAKGIDITPTPKVLDKVMIKKDVMKELKLPNNVTMDKDLHATNSQMKIQW